MVTLSVDPGLNGTGWALWSGGRLKKTGTIRVRDARHWSVRANDIVSELSSVKVTHLVSRIDCEFPAFFDSAMGHAVAKRGDLLKLTYLVGLIAGRCAPTPTVLIPVGIWKGQLPKEVIKRRAERALQGNKPRSVRGKTEHEWDAIGIGLFTLGKL